MDHHADPDRLRAEAGERRVQRSRTEEAASQMGGSGALGLSGSSGEGQSGQTARVREVESEVARDEIGMGR